MTKVCKFATNLGVEGMKAPLSHVKGITPGTHGAPEQVRLPFHIHTMYIPVCTYSKIDILVHTSMY